MRAETPLLPFDAPPARLTRPPHTLARREDPTTSQEAAHAAAGVRSEHARAILAALRTAGRPLAAEEIADRTGLSSVQVCRRFRELEDAGEVTPTDELHRNRSGRSARRFALSGGGS